MLNLQGLTSFTMAFLSSDDRGELPCSIRHPSSNWLLFHCYVSLLGCVYGHGFFLDANEIRIRSWTNQDGPRNVISRFVSHCSLWLWLGPQNAFDCISCRAASWTWNFWWDFGHFLGWGETYNFIFQPLVFRGEFVVTFRGWYLFIYAYTQRSVGHWQDFFQFSISQFWKIFWFVFCPGNISKLGLPRISKPPSESHTTWMLGLSTFWGMGIPTKNTDGHKKYVTLDFPGFQSAGKKMDMWHSFEDLRLFYLVSRWPVDFAWSQRPPRVV